MRARAQHSVSPTRISARQLQAPPSEALRFHKVVLGGSLFGGILVFTSISDDELFQTTEVARLERVHHRCCRRYLVPPSGPLSHIRGFVGEEFDLTHRLDPRLECAAPVNEGVFPRTYGYLAVGGACESSADGHDKRDACPVQAGAHSGSVGLRSMPEMGAA